MNAAAKAAGSIASKALAINIFPAPANLAESREILRVLQSYGEVTTYKAFKHDKNNFAPNRALAIYRSPTSAANFQEACPLYFALEQVMQEDDDDASSHNSTDTTPSLPTQNPPTLPDHPALAANRSHGTVDSLELDPSLPSPGDFNLITQSRPSLSSEPTPLHNAEELKRPPTLLFARSSPTPPPPRPPKPQIGLPFEPTNPTGTKIVQKQFRLTARPWQGSHRDYLSGTKFWGPFKASRSAASADLQRRLPPGSMGSIGLSDVDVWGVGEVPERIRVKRLEQGAGRKRLRMMRFEGEDRTKTGEEVGSGAPAALE